MSDWKVRATGKRRAQHESIPKEWRLASIPEFTNAREWIRDSGLLTAEELRITEITDGKALQSQLLSGSLSAETVITSFAKRAAIAQQLIGCCTEMFFEAGIARAKELDEIFKKTGKPVGPLHGFPMSFKDNFMVKDVDTTIGWVGLIGQPAPRNSPGVDIMLKLGAIIYTKTNIPQSLMMSDSYNHVFGQSVNAFNKGLISGGSSGGEAALVGVQGSMVGIGTDIGGSVRIPACLQGLYGLSPTVGRVPNAPSGLNQKYVVAPVAGPITQELSSLELYMDALCSSDPWNMDPTLLPIPWRKELAEIPNRPLKLGFIFDDGIIKPQPPVERVTRELADMLKKAGHEVIDWDSSSHKEAYDLWLSAVLADGGGDCKRLCELHNEPLIEGMLVGLPEHELSVLGRRSLEEKKIAYQEKYLHQWMESGIDALIMPVLPWVNFEPKWWVKSDQCVSYTSQWNFVNYAALAFPGGFVDPILDAPTQEWELHVPRSNSDKLNHQQYDVNLVKGMPIGLQIVGGRFGEEMTVAVAKAIKKAVTSA